MPSAKELYRRFYYKAADFLILEQERWGLWLPVFFAAGIGLYFSLLNEPIFFINAACLAGALLLFWDNRKKPEKRWLFLFIFMFFFGFFVAQFRTLTVSTPSLKTRTKTVYVSGTVETLTPLPMGRYRVVLDDVGIEGYEPYATPRKIRLSLKKETAPPAIGDTIRVRSLLSPPPLPVFPEAYDFSRALYFQKIGGVGYAREAHEIINKPQASSFTAALKRLRFDIGNQIRSVLPPETAEIAVALVTGEAKAIPKEIVENYRDSGIAHLLSVSGLHMSLIGGFVFIFIRFLLALFPAIALRYNTKKAAAVAALIITFFYMLISGANLPAQRAFIMTGIAFTAILLNRQALSVVSVAWAAFFILLFQPEALISASFQLSFAAVLALITAYEAGIGEYRKLLAKKEGVLFFLLSCLIGILATDIIASTATAPYALYHFNRYAVYSVLGNLASTTVASFIVMPSLLAGALSIPIGLDSFFFKLAGYGIAFINQASSTVAHLPHAVFLSPTMPLWGLLASTFGGLWLCLWQGKIRFLGALPFILGVISPIIPQTPNLLISGDGMLVAFKTTDGRLMLPPGKSGSLTRSIWLSRYAQTEEYPDESLIYFKEDGYQDRSITFECDNGFCLFEKDRFRIGYARSKRAAKNVCETQKLDLLFLGVEYPEECQAASQIIMRSSLYRNGTYAVWIRNDALNVQSIYDLNGFRPWTPAFPTITLKQAVMYFFNGWKYHKIKGKIISED